MRNTDLPVAIYVLEDVLCPGEVRYVGQTQSPATRFTKHLHDSRRGKKGYLLHEWLQSGVTVRMRVLRFVPVSEADACESHCIQAYRRLGFPLLNQTDGGRGVAGYEFDSKAVRMNREKGLREGGRALKTWQQKHGFGRQGASNSPQHRARISAALKGSSNLSEGIQKAWARRKVFEVSKTFFS